MTKKLTLASLITVVFLFFLIMTFPANQLYRFYRDQLPPLQMKSLTGTIWSGKIVDLSVNNIFFNKASVSIKALSLLTGKPALKIKVYSRYSQIKATVRPTGKQAYQITNLLGSTDAKLLARLLRVNSNIEGRLHFSFDELSFSNQIIKNISGSIDWHNAALNTPAKISLGKISFRFTKIRKGNIKGVIRNDSKLLPLTGTILIKPNRTYHTTITINTSAKPNSQLLAYLNKLGGKAVGQGKVKLDFDGRI